MKLSLVLCPKRVWFTSCSSYEGFEVFQNLDHVPNTHNTFFSPVSPTMVLTFVPQLTAAMHLKFYTFISKGHKMIISMLHFIS